MKTNKSIIIPQCIALIVIIQLVRCVLTSIPLSFTLATYSALIICSMCAMLALIGTFEIYCISTKTYSYVKPHRLIELYAIAGLAIICALVWVILAQKRDTETTLFAIAVTLIVPIYEELTLHGIMWHKLHKYLHRKWLVWVLTALFCGLMQIGYIDLIIDYLNINVNSTYDPISMLLVLFGGGIAMGAITGLPRFKFHNATYGMIVHSILNLVLVACLL